MDANELKLSIHKFQSEQDSKEKMQLGHNIASHYLGLNQFDLALKYAMLTLESASNIENEYAILNLIGSIYRRQNKNVEAIEYLSKALKLAESEHNNYNTAVILISIGNVYQSTQTIPDALACYEKSLKIAEENGFNNLLIPLYNNIGTIYLVDSNQPEIAIDYLRKCIKLKGKGENPETQYRNIGYAYISIADYSLSNRYYKRALEIYISQNNAFFIAECKQYIGHNYFKLGKYAKAKTFALQAASFFKGKRTLSPYCDICIQLCNIYHILGKHKKVDHYINEIDISINEVTDQERRNRLYKKYSQLCFELGHYDKAYNYLLKYTITSEGLFGDELKRNIKIATANFEYEQKRKETELLNNKNLELANHLKIIEEKNQELQNLNNSKDNLMNTISHDLKNYIGAIQMALETAIVKEASLNENKFIAMAVKSCHRAINLVKDMLYTKKLEMDVSTFTLTKDDINHFLKKHSEDIILRAKQKQLEMNFIYCKQELPAMINDDQFHRMIDNLCTNAIKFSNPNGKIEVITKKVGAFAEIHIKDNGIGIPEKSIPILFERFSGVGRKGTAGEESTGLGLYIVKSLVTLHQGTIEVQSKVGEGTTFIIKIPLV